MIVGRKIEFVNERFVEMVGYSEEELIGKSSRIVYANDAEFERVGKEKYAQIEEKGTGAVETIFQKKDGSLINIYLSSTPINMDDMSLGVIFSALDITERKKVEKALRESETRLRTYFNQGLLGMAISSKEKKWIEFNDALCEMSGYSREEFSNKSWAEMTYPDDLDANLVLYNRHWQEK
jgi:PAS domain S-box-containing protein